MKKNTLKPCPWCSGKRLRVFAWSEKTLYVECLAESCRASGPLAESHDKAVDKWNGTVERIEK